ncbi:MULTISPECIES: hydroxyisourate hydrolase [Alteromonadaceae]|uniref:hydroxyisourate hydrolase n=1 Tax=Alteromonadaceae TaxID=72275 RepID=UPI001C092D0C|nr:MULTISPECIES: hydroxyisourate hydrolase [Aliiglaciecola]MBU2876381.1 hydroxyisourate hydrolase [Aliiglaciecola lipolytica]MDO6710597.1 hydroxyisourate hydrolase [Aliiglaciecola sp. 2_MG-2023]MDO6751538.1 hydroxyisourate hydrolase [Aliiglaciecola sp. 1_MG-2023]
MNSLSSHVLDTAAGKPVPDLALQLTTPDGKIIDAQTDNDGRCNQWSDVNFIAGQYQLRFYVETYLIEKHGESFYPFVDVSFNLPEDGGHYHVPLLISPYGFSSYRGS